jgi:flagellar biosynthesis/type III secretory pathway chaperone
MDKTDFQKLIEILDKEFRAYTELKELFGEKREILKKSRSDDLGVLDNKILALNNKITEFNKERENLAVQMTGKNCNMSEFIEFAEQNAPEFVKQLEERKVKICKLIPEITLLNNQNVELLKHGIIITNKMLETIINAFAPQGSYYDETGKADSHDIDMWTISKEI